MVFSCYVYSMKNTVKNNQITLDQSLEIIALLKEQNQQQSVIISNYAGLEAKFNQLTSDHKTLQIKFEEMSSHYNWLKRQVFGKKSERFISEGMHTADLFGFEDTDTMDEPKEKEIKGHTRKSSVRKSSAVSFDDHVNVIENVIDIPEEDRRCPITGELYKKIGEDVKEEVHATPARFSKLITRRPKYAKRSKAGTVVLQAKAEPTLLRGSKFNISFIQYLLIQKYVFHIPLNRTIEQLRYHGVHVSSQALSSVVLATAAKLKGLYELMTKELLKQKYLFTDDTGAKMLQKGHGKAKDTYIWAYIGGDPSKPQYIIYKHTLRRLHDVPREHLAGFKGTITADAFGGYERLEDDPNSGISWNGCWDHARRKFEPYATTSKHAKFMMEAIRELSMNERKCWETDPQGRLEIRQNVQKPLVDEIFKQMDWIENNGGLTPSNDVLKAIRYMTSRKVVFTRFLDDPNLRIENNTSEHAVSPSFPDWFCKSLRVNNNTFFRHYIFDFRHYKCDHPICS